MTRRTHFLALVMALAFVHHALAQNPTISLIPLADDVRRECVGGPNEGQTCTATADCEVGPECQRVCRGGADDGLPCSDFRDCSNSQCAQQCSCDYVATVFPGEVLAIEAFTSNWPQDGQLLGGWQIGVDFRPIVGSVHPLGFDGPDNPISCVRDPCPPEFPVCASLHNCVGPDHDPELGFFVDSTRADYVFGLGGGAGFDFNSLHYRSSAILVNTGVTFSGSRYLATLILEVLPGINGRINIPLDPALRTGVKTSTNEFRKHDLENLTIEVVEPPEPIPATSEWGVVVLTLLLATGAKVCFGRKASAV